MLQVDGTLTAAADQGAAGVTRNLLPRAASHGLLFNPKQEKRSKFRKLDRN